MHVRRRHEEFLRSVPLFEHLLDYERLVVADALQSRVYAPGQIIIEEGSEGDEFFIIEEGEVKCTKRGIAHEVSPRLQSGAYFGELALMHDTTRAASVTAVTKVQCQVLDRETFSRLLGPLEDIFERKFELYQKYQHELPSQGCDRAVSTNRSAGDDVPSGKLSDEEETKA